MLRKLSEDDRQMALDYLAIEPSYNVFTIGDIENFGFGNEFQDVWGDFDKHDKLRALMLRYYNNHIVYSAVQNFSGSAICEVLHDWQDDWVLSGKEQIIRPLASELGLNDIRQQFIAEQRCREDISEPPADTHVEWCTQSTSEEVLGLQRSIEEFALLDTSVEGIRQNMESGTGRTVFIRRDSEVVSCASSAAENSRSAMIIGVCTSKAYRRKGFATACMKFLCHALHDRGKVPCLFYDNPEAARIYRRLGFVDVGRWVVAKRRKAITLESQPVDF